MHSKKFTTNYANKKCVLIASKVGHVTLATPPLGSFIVPYVVGYMAYPKKKKTKSLASSVEKLWRAGSQNLKK